MCLFGCVHHWQPVWRGDSPNEACCWYPALPIVWGLNFGEKGENCFSSHVRGKMMPATVLDSSWCLLCSGELFPVSSILNALWSCPCLRFTKAAPWMGFAALSDCYWSCGTAAKKRPLFPLVLLGSWASPLLCLPVTQDLSFLFPYARL